MKKKLALIDGYSFVFRAYYSLPPLSRADKTPVGAVYGFVNMLIKLVASIEVTHIAVIFDSGSKTFRNEIYKEYKAHRPPCPPDLLPQFPIIREAVEALNIVNIEKVGFEADDIIATFAKEFSKEEETEILIVSSDKDLMQLIDKNVFMYDPMKNKFIRENEVAEKFFVRPNQVIDLLALMGDASDNIPGVKGIGPKTAARLINEFDNVENIYENIEKLKSIREKTLLIENKENAYLSKKLVQLRHDVAFNFGIDDLKVKEIESQKLINFLNEQGFKSLVTKFSKALELNEVKATNLPKDTKTNFNEVFQIKEITDLKQIDEIHKLMKKNGNCYVDFIAGDLILGTHDNENIFKSLKIYYAKILQKTNHEADLFSHNQKTESGFLIKDFDNIFSSNIVKKIFLDSKNFFKFSLIENILFEDILVINYLVNSDSNSNFTHIVKLNIDEMESEKFSEITNILEKKLNQEEIFTSETAKSNYYIYKIGTIVRIFHSIYDKVQQLKLNNSYYKIEKPLIEILAIMENNGFLIDLKKIKELSVEFSNNLQKLSEEIYKIAGREFNIASTKQLSEILFNEIGLKSTQKSKKTGNLSTNSAVLEDLAFEGVEIASKILEYRKFAKLINTYTDSLPKFINSKTKRIHSNFSSINTLTGRFSSNNPNLQNIPVRSEEGKKIRECFIAKKGHKLIMADYSQIELRVIAHIAKISSFIDAFKEDKDIHKITASKIFKVAEELVTKEMRYKAKAINFGIIYGISGFGLAKQIKSSRKEAQNFIDAYFAEYPEIKSYMEDVVNFATNHEYIETITGRKCYIKGINDKNFMAKSEAKRVAINAPIQGSAADIIKLAMINVCNSLKNNKVKADLILQIHDELIFEVENNDIEKATQIILSEMENAIKLDIPLKVDIETNERWV